MEASPIKRTTPVQVPDDPSTELSSRRTGMSFQRTRMSADRTLMSVIRTAFSLISFGFTIVQVFNAIDDSDGASQPARRFGITLVVLGILMLASGIAYHVAFMRGLRDERERLKGEGLIHAESAFPHSMTLAIAIFVLVFGLFTIAGIVLRSWPFG
jgi:putative membrane protein